MFFPLGYAKSFLCSINLLGNTTSNKTHDKREENDKIAKFVQKVKGLKITNNAKQYQKFISTQNQITPMVDLLVYFKVFL